MAERILSLLLLWDKKKEYLVNLSLMYVPWNDICITEKIKEMDMSGLWRPKI